MIKSINIQSKDKPEPIYDGININLFLFLLLLNKNASIMDIIKAVTIIGRAIVKDQLKLLSKESKESVNKIVVKQVAKLLILKLLINPKKKKVYIQP